jgi:hypothetical protein
MIRPVAVLVLVLAAGCGGLRGQPPLSEPESAPEVARVDCVEAGTRLETPTVEAQADGVHIRVRNEAGRRVSFSVDEIGGDNPEGEQVWPIPPGLARVGCWKEGQEDPDWVALPVIDPRGLWVSPELECLTGGVAGSSGGSYGSPPKGDPRDPVEIGRDFFETIAGPLGPDDVVERAGYPNTEIRQVRLVRDGLVVAVAEYVDASWAGGEPGSGWIEQGYEACDGV